MLTNQARGEREWFASPFHFTHTHFFYSFVQATSTKEKGGLECVKTCQPKQKGRVGEFNCELCQLKRSTFTLRLHKPF